MEKCLSKSAIATRHGRQIERLQNQDAVDKNKKRLDTKVGKAIYKRRQAIVEHPFGIIKRQWDCSYTMLRGIEKVNGEFAIVFTCYNLRRAVSIMTVSTLLERLKALPKHNFDLSDKLIYTLGSKDFYFQNIFILFLQSKRKTLCKKAEKLLISSLDVRKRIGSFFTDCVLHNEKKCRTSFKRKERKFKKTYQNQYYCTDLKIVFFLGVKAFKNFDI
jgi:predicted lipase